MDYFLTEVTLPVIGWTYKRLVDPPIQNMRRLGVSYTEDYERHGMLRHIDESLTELGKHLPRELTTLACEYMSPEAKTHADHVIYKSTHTCSLCHIPYISQADMVTTACYESLTLVFGILLLCLIVVLTYKLGKWVHGIV